ncbi:membrane protein [Propionigenium maris DSM 9537]|uniref:Membrane protein n=1 Tax=Propionigenium maris DSM 9537 TaxID=1123000 RepID=A0A9W6GKV6_9FUSO|nr:YjiH family protein [Propionigenium maris]GLI55611.1 membrane protein [Propionigenium maris DSM 9537]
MSTISMNQVENKSKAKFIIPSLLGIALFLLPIPYKGQTTVMLGHINGIVKNHLTEGVLFYGVIASAATIVMSILGSVFNLSFITENKVLKSAFVTGSLSLLVRVAGAIMYMMVYFQVGPQLLIGGDTGGLVVNDFIGSLFVTFTVGNLILPFLLDFGLLEFLGNLLKPVMRKLFNVPGRSAVDAIASFVGDGTLGILVTDEQHAQGYYTKREATLIATCFSVVGIAFTAFVAGELGFSSRFPLFYGTIVFTSFTVALIMSRLPIITKYPDEYMEGVGKQLKEDDKKVSVDEAFDIAVDKAQGADIGAFTKMLPSIFNIHMTFIPVIVFVGTCGLMVAEATPIFSIIASPLVPVFEFLNIPDAKLVAEASLVGFTDMYLPTIFIKGSEYEISRFIVGTLSFTQLIFMAETGSILLKTKMNFNFLEVLGFFLARTAISLPIIIIIAKLFV